MDILPILPKESIHFFEQQFLPQLSPQIKRISAIALLIVSCFSACFLLYYTSLKFRKVEPKKAEPLSKPQNLPALKEEVERAYHQQVKSFSFKVFQKMINESQTENQLTSPLGISLLMSMIQHGVNQENQREIADVICLPKDESEMKVCAYQLIEKLKHLGLDIAGLLYLNAHYRLNPEYQRLVSQHYQSKVESGSSADEVNAWVKQATNGQIQEIIAQNDLVDFFVALVNAIHFKATWAKPFKKEDTFSAIFATPNELVEAETMHTIEQFDYFEDDNCQAIKLPYRDKSGVSMMLMLPKKDNDFRFVEDSFFETFSKGKTTEMVKLAVPKFKIEHEIDVKIFLENMGLEKLFAKPDFSPLVDLSHPPSKEILSQLRISKMSQKTALACDEEGTEASSVTVAVVQSKSCHFPPGHSKEINFNHPFLAALISEETQIPIQLGIIRDPVGQSS
jgi:serpin B